jgi:hypothetical protein
MAVLGHPLAVLGHNIKLLRKLIRKNPGRAKKNQLSLAKARARAISFLLKL